MNHLGIPQDPILQALMILLLSSKQGMVYYGTRYRYMCSLVGTQEIETKENREYFLNGKMVATSALNEISYKLVIIFMVINISNTYRTVIIPIILYYYHTINSSY